MMLRFGRLAIFAAALLAASPSVLHAQAANEGKGKLPPPQFLVMGTGGVTGFYYPVGGAVCRVVNALRARTNTRCLVESTAGSLHNLNGLRIGDLDLAMVQSGWAYQAVKGIGAFAVEGKGGDLRALMALHGEPLTLVARKDSGIATASDIKRRKVSLGRKGTSQRQLMEALFNAMGWSQTDFPQAVEMEADDQIEALCSGKIEVAAYVIAHPISVIEDALMRCNARIIDVDAKTVQKLEASYPFLVSITIPEKVYDGQVKAVQTFGMRAMLVTTAHLPAASAETIVLGIIDNFERFQHLHPSLELLNIDKLSAVENIMPLHDGAKRAYRDRRLLKR